MSITIPLLFSSLAVAINIASTHLAYPRRDDQAELAWVKYTKIVTLLADTSAMYTLHCKVHIVLQGIPCSAAA